MIYSIACDASVGFSSEMPLSIQICAFLFALISVVDFFVPKFKFADKWIHKFANFIEDCNWRREMKRGERYLNM